MTARSSFFVFCCFLLAAGPIRSVQAQDCVAYQPEGIGILDTITLDANYTYDIEVIGDVGIVGTSRGLYALDLTDLENLSVIGFYEQFGCINLASIDNLVGISSQDHGLIFVDVSDPANMTHVRTYSEFTFSQEIIAHGEYFYVGNNHLGVITVDATDHSDPAVTGLTGVDERVVDLAAQGTWLFSVGYDSQLVVWSLADPAQPVVQTVAGGYSLGRANSLITYGNHLYMSTYSDGLKVVNVTYPASPVWLGLAPTSGPIYTLATIGDRLFGGNSPSVQAFDLGNPAMPSPIGRLVSSLEVWDLAVHGDRLVGVASDHAVISLDVSGPESTLPIGIADTGGDAQDVTFGDTEMYVANGNHGLLVRSYPGAYPISETTLSGFLHSVTLDGDLAYLAMDDAGLQIADVSDPAAPVLLDDINTSGHARDVALYTNASGTYAMVADTEYDLVKYDVTDPTFIRPKGIHYFAGHVYAVEVAGDHVLAADNSGHLQVLDLSVLPDQPEVVASLELEGSPSSLRLDGNLLYVGGGTWLSTVDVSDPAAPVQLGAVELPLGIADLDVAGGVAYCALPVAGMQLVDVSDPTDLRLMALFDSQGMPTGIGVRGDRVYLTVGPDGMVYLPLQCLASSAPEQVARLHGRLLKPAYPNPFNPLTNIAFELPRTAAVNLDVFDLKGRRVRSLITGETLSAGAHSVRWNGLDDQGRAAPSGVYFYRLQAGEQRDTRRMALVR